MTSDKINAFLSERLVTVPAQREGSLSGFKFAVKELFDVKGHITGCGNPNWLIGRQPARQHADCVQSLLDAGASLQGRTISDEMAFSLDGENAHYGTPVNPASANAIAGGSSAGSASAVACGTVDFALGTDTAGSVRIPAAYCGIYGFRPSHGLVPIDNVHPMAKSFDAVGWFAKSAQVMEKVSRHFIKAGPEIKPIIRLIKVSPLFDGLNQANAKRFDTALAQIASSGVEVIESGSDWFNFDWLNFEMYKAVLPKVQWYELNQAHGPWIRANIETFGEEIRGRLRNIASVTENQYQQHLVIKQQLIEQINQHVSKDTVLVFPTAPDVAPAKGRSIEQARAFRARLMNNVCMATVAGLPQLTMPLLNDTQGPLGLSLMAGKGQDSRLLAGLSLFKSMG